MQKQKITVFWFRRDLRFEDNRGLFEALKSPFPVLPLFIFDTNIVDELEEDDSRISFIYDHLYDLSVRFKEYSGSIYCKKGTPEGVWKDILKDFDVQDVYANEDYEPYAIQRDKNISILLNNSGVNIKLFKDQVIFAKKEILKADQSPYVMFTPYKNKWLSKFDVEQMKSYASEKGVNFLKINLSFPSLSDLGFVRSSIKAANYDLDNLDDYEKDRDFPALNNTSHLSPHLRFGTISIRQVIRKLYSNKAFVNELIWREFFMQVLYRFPDVVHSNFKHRYDNIEWRNKEEEFEKWKNGETGYPFVDAGMRELNATGIIHNRVRMIVAGFLCKHLLIDWRWGEAYFAEKLLDYELSSNNGNWQWASGTGCDSAPYFRVFNPSQQAKKFDPYMEYIKKWVPEIDSQDYPSPIVDHRFARERAINVYKEGIQKRR